MNQKLDRLFHLSQRKTSVKTEALAGFTTFITMAYILAVNPNILGAAGMDPGAVFTATCLSSLIATVCMALFSNYPFVLAPGMGLNAYFAYSVVIGMGYSWQTALAAVFVEGIIFIVLTLTPVREGIFNSIPMCLKHAITAGIGLFIAFIGLQNAKLIVGGATLVELYNWKANAASFSTEGVTVVLALLGILITAVLVAKKVRGGILLGILITWALGILCQLTGLYQVDPSVGAYSLLPDFSAGLSIPSMAPTFLQMDFSKLLSLDFLVVVLSFLFLDMFDTIGGLIGISEKAQLLDKDGHLPKVKGALMADAVGTTVGAVCGTSTVTTFAESAAGVSEGGRTGLTSLVAAGFFGLSLFLSPIFLAIPSFATAPALVLVGFMMMDAVLQVKWKDLFQSIPAFLTLLAIPFAYSISDGIALGVISYVVLNLFGGKDKRTAISPVMYALAALFLLKYILL